MRNSKGFTLAELLGVLTLLAIIALITVPLVNKYITNSRQKAYNAEMTTLKTAAQQWFVKNSASVQWDENGYYALNLDVLKQSEFLGDEAIYNPLYPDEEITGCIIIGNDNGNYSYSYSSTCAIDSDYLFEYTGSIQTVNLSVGTYKLEVWGAAGTTASLSGGYGAYAVGTYTLLSPATLYVVIGGTGTAINCGSGTSIGGYNGGAGTGLWSNSEGLCGPGGGATHIATASGLLSTLSSNKNAVLIVAGGGGGGSDNSAGNAGGGYIGMGSNGGTQVSSTTVCGNPGFGTAGDIVNGTCGWYGGGGGGWYGGSSGLHNGGSGGSGYIGGVNSSNGVTKAMYCYNCSTSSVADTLTFSTTNSSASATSNYAKLGNGYAKITKIG